jgi:hypothetical protein
MAPRIGHDRLQMRDEKQKTIKDNRLFTFSVLQFANADIFYRADDGQVLCKFNQIFPLKRFVDDAAACERVCLKQFHETRVNIG